MPQEICVQLLSRGFVTSYVKFFNLHHHLERSEYPTLQQLLMKVEESFRSKNEHAIFETNTSIAKAHNVNDVAIEYFKKALEAAKKLTKEFYYEVEATCNLALAIRECGGFNEALTDFEKALELSTIKEDQDRQTICLDYLLETLLKIANNSEKSGNYDAAIENYEKCLEFLKKRDPTWMSENSGDILFRLGKAFMEISNVESAIKKLELLLENIKNGASNKHEGAAQLLLASCYEAANKQNMAISYLEIFINQAQADPDQKENESRACNQLGELYNKIGKYELAVPYFERHFAILNETSNETVKNDKESDTWRNYRAKTKDIRSAKVQLGIAKANDNLNFYFETVSDPKGVGALLQWKSQQTFGDYIPPTQRVMVSQ